MKKGIIFGAGIWGGYVYDKVKDFYEIAFYVDNNSALWGQTLRGIEIKNPDSLSRLEVDDIFIASYHYETIFKQLQGMGIESCVVFREGFLYQYNRDRVLRPKYFEGKKFLNQKKAGVHSILFVQCTACVRTHKIAQIAKNHGFHTALAYTMEHPVTNNPNFIDVYDEIFPINNMQELINAVNDSDFDLIHSSNQPDYLTNLLLYSNKKVIHDVHDLTSIYEKVTPEMLIAEHVANVKTAGVIYTSEGAKQIAIKKFRIPEEKIFVLENKMSTGIESECIYPKLSESDHQLHCVYEGGISGDPKSFRYYEIVWKKIIEAGVHIHFYSSQYREYCIELDKKSPYLHYEGNCSSIELASEMTRYDCGLVLLNVKPKNRMYLETSSPNKLYEYWNAGLPVIVGDISSHARLVEGCKGGIQLDLNQDIYSQILKASQINISKTFLEDNHLLMNQSAGALIDYYLKIIGNE